VKEAVKGAVKETRKTSGQHTTLDKRSFYSTPLGESKKSKVTIINWIQINE
jgi:hypothetical protein